MNFELRILVSQKHQHLHPQSRDMSPR